MPKVSIIIPCYNQGKYLQDALNSILHQTFTDWEIIIIDDGSTDDFTIQILDKLVFKNTKILRTHNMGLASARNTGISHAIGKYILPLDADDVIGETYLEKSVTYFEENNNTKIVYCNAKYFGDSNEDWILPEFSMTKMLLQNLIFCSAVFRKCDYDKTEGYNCNMKYGWEDWDLWLSLIQKDSEVYKIPEVLFYYRKHPISMVSNIAQSEMKRKYLEQQIISNHIDLYKNIYSEPLTMLRELEGLRIEKQQFEVIKKTIYNSLSYRIGDFILYPLKLISNFIKS